MHGNDLQTSETWDSSHLHVVNSILQVNDGATLTILPGTTVKFSTGAGLNLGSDGSNATLIAQGTMGQPITLTSAAANPSAGDWVGLIFHAGQGHVVSQTLVQYAGYGSASAWGPAVNVQSGAGLAISDSIIDSGASNGLAVQAGGALVSFARNTLTNNGDHAIVMNIDQVAALDTASTFSGNGFDRVRVRGGDLAASATWFNPGIPIVLAASSSILSGANLQLSPGVKLMFAPTAVFTVGSNGPAQLNAGGTADQPIYFDANSMINANMGTAGSTTALSTAGQYGGIVVANGSAAFAHVNMWRGGAGLPGEVEVGAGANLSIDSCAFNLSSSHAIAVDAGGTLSPADGSGSSFSDDALGNILNQP